MNRAEEMINDYENTLRKIIILTIGSDDDSDYGVSPDRLQKWKDKREIEDKKYKGLATETRIIYYSDFYDLKTIITKRWELVSPILQEKKRFEVFFDEVEKFRNTIAHGRDLFSYQQNLLNGIIQDLKTQLVMFHNKNMNADDYFIRILKVSDSLGNIHEPKGARFVKITEKILRVGDTIEFNIEAIDPKGRKIQYRLETKGENILSDQQNISITVTEKMIGKSIPIELIAETSDSEYNNSAYVQFFYTILP